jgi:hypothetical protein
MCTADFIHGVASLAELTAPTRINISIMRGVIPLVGYLVVD